MSAEVKATVEGNSSGFGSHYYVSGVTIVNHNSYHVEVTVRRVPEKVVLAGFRVGDFGGKWVEAMDKLVSAGYRINAPVKITVEPLE